MKIKRYSSFKVTSLLLITLFSASKTLSAEVYTAADCLVLPHKVTKLSSPVMGVLSDVKVLKSDQVTKGQVVATLESTVEAAAVELAKVRAEIDSEVEEGKVNTAYDQKRKKRMDSLFQQKNISEDIKDEFERDERLAKARLQQAMDLKKIRQFELAGAQARLAQKTIKAPFDGYVLEVSKNPGEYVEEQSILTIAQLDPLNIEAILPIEFFGKVKPGMQASIHIEAFPDKSQTAKVVVVDPIGNAAAGTFGVRLELPNPNNKIPAGLKCQAKF